ncbi:STM4012 family radical SAM protein [Tepidibacter hydrothermalis]|uniref:Heme chaperone HemW n=1 Tax=Tepidibacter hydrothermalis TaxID=3036126 RepID=A0ABY8EIK8_9FIRM|nr:STM4012 family radical SAM protein [Tepidibacter hydrothermalis]WFD11815.1 STM4012 family radical SAM protein [Tepidibacter hydrothermalis]
MKKYFNDNPYTDYIYSYPHKKSYRELEEKINLKELWSKRKTNNLTLYIHIPFCINKCGYCNLLSTTCFSDEKLEGYVEKLVEELKGVKRFLNIKEDESVFSSVIFGGGTPTILKANLMEYLLSFIEKNLNIDFEKTFFSIETSPRTFTKKHMDVLKRFHINRISMGIQSFKENELKKIYRFESIESIEESIDIIFNEDVEIKNLDLIYGIPSQTIDTWKESLLKVIEFNPEEIFIYPLYVREKTKLYNEYSRDFDKMIEMYDIGREILISRGYVQTSMRNFIREDMKDKLYPSYGCQENEMIGIGCGARSYISNVHYSRKYAVDQKNINKIIDNYLKEDNFDYIKYGYILSEEEEKRKYILKSILKVTGLDINMYFKRFKEISVEEFKDLSVLIKEGFLIEEKGRILPSEKGLKYSDIMGTLFISDEVKDRVKEFIE